MPDVNDYLDEALAQYPNVPRDVAERLIGVESGGREGAVSPKGARGTMQLMPGTAAEMGVDPTDPRQNVLGGVGYLSKQIDRFGSVPLGVAAYHAGPGAVEKAGGIPDTSDGITRTPDYVRKIAGNYLGGDAQNLAPYRGDDSGAADTPLQPRAKKPWETGPQLIPMAPGAEPADEASNPIATGAKILAHGAAGMGSVIGQGIEATGRAVGLPDVESAGRAVRNVSQDAEETWRNSLPAHVRQAMDSPLITEDFQLGPTPVATTIYGILDSLPSLVAMGGAGKVLQYGGRALGAGERIGRFLETLYKADGMPAADAAAKAAKWSARTLEGGAFGGSQGVYMGLQAAAETEHRIEQTDPNDLNKSPAYQQAFSATDAALPTSRRAEIARESIARDAGDFVFSRALAWNGTLGVMTGGGVFQKWGTSRLANAGIDAGVLGAQGAGGQVISNLGQREFANPDQPLGLGAVNAGLQGAVMGAAFGATRGGHARPASEAPVEFNKAEAPNASISAGEQGTEPISEAMAGAGEAPYTSQPPVSQPVSSDIGRAKDGAPFANRRAAQMALEQKGLADTHEVTPADAGGYVLRAKPETAAVPQEQSDAVRQPEAGAVLQREPGEAGIRGSERLGMEPGEQGQEAAAPREPNGAGDHGQATEEVEPGMVRGPMMVRKGKEIPPPDRGVDGSPDTKPQAEHETAAAPAVDTETGEIPQPARPAGTLEHDLLNDAGQPFATKQEARAARAKKGVGLTAYDPVKIDEGWVLRPRTKAGDIKGESPVSQAELQPHEREVDVPVIEAETGRAAKVKMKAGEALDALDEHINRAKALLECLSS